MKKILFLYFISPLIALAQIVSPFNKVAIKEASDSTYSFFVGGHFHGSSTNVSGFPASSLLANIDLLNADSNAFLISTGDLFLDVSNNIPAYQSSFFNKLKIPLFNAVGNHDVSGNVYNQNFGSTWSKFIIGSELFIILDAEINDGSIKGEQFLFLQRALQSVPEIKNIFIFTHRPVWAEEHEKLKNVFTDNTQSDFGTNFQSDIYPLLSKLASSKKIYWFSGSMGANAPASFFYYRDKQKITFIQSAIRDLPRDGVLRVNIKKSNVSFETISFSGQAMPKLESCGLDLWKNAPTQKPFNYRLIPLYMKQMLFSRYFWYGLLSGFLVLLMLYFTVRKIKSKKIG